VSCPDVAATEELGAAIAREARPGDVIGLCGPLGAGKTVLVRGAVRGLGGDPALVRSPTFTLMNVYPCVPPIHHFDLYRLASADDLEGIGFHEFAHADGVSFVEWADRFPELGPQLSLRVDIGFAGRGERRRVSLTGSLGKGQEQED